MKSIHGSKTINVSRPLGELEKEVMIVLWEIGKATGKEVWRGIKTTRKVALTTVLTVIDRLSRKGLISKSKEDGFLVYRPFITKEDYTKQVAGKMLKDYMDLSSASLIASFVDTLEEMEPDQIDKLSRYIEKKRKEGPR